MMEDGWERRRILVWGKTRPELSTKYKEIVCTGGVFADTKKLVRLFPIPLRFMKDPDAFKKYRWIEADVCKSSVDRRPESYRIRVDTISALEALGTENGSWSSRAAWVLQPQNIFRSVEELQARQRADLTSLGLVRPKEIRDVRAERFSDRERDEFWTRYKDALSQMELTLDPDTGKVTKPITPPDFRFKINFRCDDPECTTDHSFSVLDWEIDALYFRLRGRFPAKAAAQGVRDHLLKSVCSKDKDLYFFLGNINGYPQVFTIVGLWYPKNTRKQSDPSQGLLF
jgi:hypothetical protein